MYGYEGLRMGMYSYAWLCIVIYGYLGLCMAMGQNLTPDDTFLPRSKIVGKVEFDAIKTSGDGNCLYRSASLILVGNEDLHLLLRLLTAIELFLHASYYAMHP